MAHPQLTQAVEARLTTYWDDRTPVVGPNSRGSAPDDGGPYLAIEYPFSTTEQISLGAPGANTHRESGTFRVIINWYAGVGWIYDLGDGNPVTDVRDWVQEISDLFRGMIIGGVAYGTPQSPVHDARNDEGNYYQLAIAIPYDFDFNG